MVIYSIYRMEMIRNYQNKGSGPSVDVSGLYASINQLQIQINDLYTRTIIPSSDIEIPSSLTVQFVRLSSSVTGVISSIRDLETFQNSLLWDIHSIHQSTDMLSIDMFSMSQYMASLGQSVNDLSTKMTGGGGGGGSGESSTVPTLYNITTPGTYTNPISYQKSMFNGHMTYMISNISAPTMYFEDIYFNGPGGYTFSALSADKVFADGMIRLFSNCSFKTLSIPNDSHFALWIENCTINELYWTRVSINDTELTNSEAWLNSCSFDKVSLHIDCSALVFDGAMLILDNCTVANDMTVYIPQTTRTTDYMYIGLGIRGGKYYPELIKNWTVYNADIGLNDMNVYGELRFNEPLHALGVNKGVFGGITATMNWGVFEQITCGDMSINITPRNTTFVRLAECSAANVDIYTPKRIHFSNNTFNNLNFTASVVSALGNSEYNTVTGYLRGMLTETVSQLSFICPYKMITLLSTLA